MRTLLDHLHPYKDISDEDLKTNPRDTITNHGSAEPPWNSTIENGELGLICIWIVKLVIRAGKIAFSLFQFEGSEPLQRTRCQPLKNADHRVVNLQDPQPRGYPSKP